MSPLSWLQQLQQASSLSSFGCPVRRTDYLPHSRCDSHRPTTDRPSLATIQCCNCDRSPQTTTTGRPDKPGGHPPAESVSSSARHSTDSLFDRLRVTSVTTTLLNPFAMLASIERPSTRRDRSDV